MDETTPLLPDAATSTAVPALQDDQRLAVPDKDIVDFDPSGDPDNPMDWPAAYKWGIVALLAAMAFTVTFTCVSLVPIANIIVGDLDGGAASGSAAVLLVTIWELGEAAGPLLIAPLSEVLGRLPVVHVANVLFVAFTVLCALSPTPAALVAARALTGAAVASNVLAPAVVGDLFPPERRGAALSLVQLAPLAGGAVGPAVAGAVSQTAGWRRSVWTAAALAAACEAAFLAFFRETYRVPILRRRAARLRAATGDPALRTAFDAARPPGRGRGRGWGHVAGSVLRPAVVLRSSFVLQVMSFYGSLLFSYFYIMSTTLPALLQNGYGFTPAATGLAFITFSVGSTAGLVVINATLDRVYVRLRDANKGVGLPEHRLPLVIAGSVLFPTAVILYGWSAQLQLHVSILLLSVALMGAFLMLGFMPLMAYVVDAFGIYSASSITALIVTRCLMGTFLPLSAQPLIEKLGYGWGLSILAAISIAMIPIPVSVFRYGEKWRQLSKYTRG